MIDDLLLRAGNRVALLIGNGIHIYKNGGQSWNTLIESLARKNNFASPEMAKNLSMPEFYDLIELARPTVNGPKSDVQKYPLKRQFCNGMDKWEPSDHHRAIVEWAKRQRSPILTTNFDQVLSTAAGATRHSLFRARDGRSRATDYYPWEKYFAHEPLNNPCDGFGIWHINGFISHLRSIRLGLSDYMGCVARCRPWILHAKTFPDWVGQDTWVDILLKMPLVAFGIGLEEQEVWLRWLLIQRANLYKKHDCKRPPAWYVYPAEEENAEGQAEKRFFLQCLGLEPHKVTDFSAIYDPQHWTN